MLLKCYIFGALWLAAVAAGPSAPSSGPTSVNMNGYIAETHNVTTKDGYILGVKRIPYARYQTSGDQNRPVVFCMHGFGGQWQNTLGLGPELAPGYNLADAGFDVWFGNARGNIYSRRHVSLNPDNPLQARRFFDFTWEEIGMIDLPTMIDYILAYTGQEKLHYIGGSQGGTVFLVMGSMKPEYNQKMASVHFLSGVGYQKYFPNEALKSVAPYADILYGFTQTIGLVEFKREFLALITGAGTGSNANLIEAVGAMAPVDETTAFGGASMKSLFHFLQNIRDKLFRRFHYGIGNFIKYGSANPPLYDLSLITSNVTMHYAPADEVLDYRDVVDMANAMPNTVIRVVARDTFKHADFIQAADAKVLVTDFIIESINNVHNG